MMNRAPLADPRISGQLHVVRREEATMVRLAVWYLLLGVVVLTGPGMYKRSTALLRRYGELGLRPSDRAIRINRIAGVYALLSYAVIACVALVGLRFAVGLL